MARVAETHHVHASQLNHTRHVMNSPTPLAEAANDREFYRNPLWLVAGAMGLLFALLACLTAAG
jgi:hypothetical protein